MSELQQRLNKLMLRLDHMGMRAEQALADALRAVAERNIEAGHRVDLQDATIDREEVEIEQECIRLLALYQPAAIDLRTLCTVIKVNSDLERIADLAASIGRRVKHVVEDGVSTEAPAGFERLCCRVTDLLGRTVRMLAAGAGDAQAVIDGDRLVDDEYSRYVRAVLDDERNRPDGAGRAMTLLNLAKALERIGDLCTNIGEDIIFLRTGDIVRHSDAFRSPA
jgi:phosphate transport system protein